MFLYSSRIPACIAISLFFYVLFTCNAVSSCIYVRVCKYVCMLIQLYFGYLIQFVFTFCFRQINKIKPPKKKSKFVNENEKFYDNLDNKESGYLGNVFENEDNFDFLG